MKEGSPSAGIFGSARLAGPQMVSGCVHLCLPKNHPQGTCADHCP